MQLTTPVPERRLGPYPLDQDGIGSQVDLCAERFDGPPPTGSADVFAGSELVFEASGGTWSALHPWDQ